MYLMMSYGRRARNFPNHSEESSKINFGFLSIQTLKVSCNLFLDYSLYQYLFPFLSNLKRGRGMEIQNEQQYFLRLKALKMEHQDEKFFLATTVVTMIVMIFVFDSM